MNKKAMRNRHVITTTQAQKLPHDIVQPPPYHTGKIKIGVYYKPPRQQQSDEDLMLQSLLLGDKTNFMPQFHFDIKYLMYLIMGFVGYLVVMALVR
jgi:hypothetical protein